MAKPTSPPLYPRRSSRLLLSSSPTPCSTEKKKTSKKPSTPRFSPASTPAGNAEREPKKTRSSSGKGGVSGSNLLHLADTSEKKAFEMIKNRLGESDWGALSSEKCLRSRKVKMSLDATSKREKRKKDYSGEISELEETSLAKKKKMESFAEETQKERMSSLRRCLESNSNLSSSLPSGNYDRGNVKVMKFDPLASSPNSLATEKNSHDNEETDLDLGGHRVQMSDEVTLRRSQGATISPIKLDDVKVKAPAKPQKEQQLSSKKHIGLSGNSNNTKRRNSDDHDDEDEYNRCFFIGKPVPDDEARERWPWRYETKSRRAKGRSLKVIDDEADELVLNVKYHYAQAQINEGVFDLGDCAYMRGEEGTKHIGKIIEFFQTNDGEDYCRVQWFYRAEDTVMKEEASFHEKQRIFYSNIMNDNLLDCVVSKIKVVQVTPQLNMKRYSTLQYDYFYDMEYCLDYSTFRIIPTEIVPEGHDHSSHKCTEPTVSIPNNTSLQDSQISEVYSQELSLLDLYSGCGAMSTGLCLGARLSGVNLMTRWAVDADIFACKSLRLNHPETRVRNETAEEFLELLKQWEKLCKRYKVDNWKRTELPVRKASRIDQDHIKPQSDDEEFEVERLVDICFGNPDESGKKGLKFKVRWKGYGLSEDTWEPIEGLRNCQGQIHDFVTKGLKSKILPLPGEVDVICGGPPCQGISGYNRFRSIGAPFQDNRNRQLVVFMDIVKFLKPKYVLMENVMDILRFDKASLGRYALSRLVHMSYQARVGIMAAGSYGLPQFRLRTFFWGALPSEDLPQFPLPTHDVIMRYWPPPEFERNIVAYDEGQSHNLQDALVLRDAISDLPAVKYDETADEMPYGKPPETEFQTYMRSGKQGKAILYDHRPLSLSEDDYIRVCHIPHRKGANFRDLPGITVGPNNVVRRDPTSKPTPLPSGKPMVPDYALTFEQGKSKRPFARLWWDETMATVVTTACCHSQAILHPEQDRVLTVRECARLQGFPDHYHFSGTVKKRYRQIGNAVAVPVTKALGYALGMASQKLIGKEHLMELPPNFAYQID